MKFSEIVDQASDLLQRKGRITYRALKLEFDLSEEQLEVLKEELIEAHELAFDKDGKMLIWREENTPAALPQRSAPPSQSPASYTPKHLAERIRSEQAAMESRGTMGGERKTITALFADLKGSTALIEGLDPEEARAIIDPALQLMMDAVHQYDGYVAQALGDGIFALFGAPLAHEDHPQRALYAALRMQEAMRHYGDTLRAKGYPPLLMRVGLNTGEVVLRSIRKDDLHADYVPVGHSTNLAARMEQLASPGSIVVSAYTHRLTDGYFTFKDLGPTPIKGVEEPLNLYEVLGVGALRTRLQVSATRRGLTWFVGRQSEMEQLTKALEHAKAGHGQIVGTMGEPGLGKSRLFYEFKLTSPSGYLVLEALSVSYGKVSPYLPVIELLKTYFEITLEDDERKRREKVNGKVLTLDRSLEDTLPYLFALLGIEDPTSSLPQMDPQVRRRRTFAALKRLLLRESLNQPLILIFEDLHWIDSETQGLLDMLSESVASARILLLVNYRPEYRHEWGQKTYYTQLRLAPLGKEEADELLTFLLGNDASLKALKPLILGKTEGTPFFMEEVVQTLVEERTLLGERGNHRLKKAPTELHISPTVQGVLAARIDRLAPDEKALLQQLAVIGREFPLRLVRQVVPQAEEELYRLLASLQQKEFLYEQPAFPEVEYMFKHPLTQEVAYGSVLIEQRKVLHEQTGQAIEQLYKENLDEHYSNLAHHYTRSGKTEKAVEYLHLAGQQAVQRSANAEAITHLTTALALLQTLPDTPERVQRELTLHLTLGPLLRATKGFAALEVERVYTRARDLCERIGETLQYFSALRGLWGVYFARGQWQLTKEVGAQLLRLAEHTQDRALLSVGHHVMGMAACDRGEFPVARTHFERGIALYDPHCLPTPSSLYLLDPGVECRAWLAETLWYLGYPEQALKWSREALLLSYDLPHRLNLAGTLWHTANLHRFRGELPLFEQHAEALRTLATEQGFSFQLALSTVLQGWMLVEQGNIAEGLAHIRQRRVTSEVGLSKLLSSFWLAEAYGKAGHIAEGLLVVAEGLAERPQDRGRFTAELYRLKGTLTLQSTGESPRSGVEAEAEACFLKAIDIAREQQAKSLELRAVLSLSRLWQRQGKTTEARQLLSEIYNWFTEGFDTKDLQDAKALLDELTA